MENKSQLVRRQKLIKKIKNAKARKQDQAINRLNVQQQHSVEIKQKQQYNSMQMQSTLLSLNCAANSVVTHCAEHFFSCMDYLDDRQLEIDLLDKELIEISQLTILIHKEIATLNKKQQRLSELESKNYATLNLIAEQELDAMSLIRWVHKEDADV